MAYWQEGATFNSWDFRKAITISDPDATLTNYQVDVIISHNSNMNADFSDIRFADSDAVTAINYTIHSKKDSDVALASVKVPSIPDGGKTIFMYYGNSKADDASDAVNTYDTLEDWEQLDWERNPEGIVSGLTGGGIRETWGSIWKEGDRWYYHHSHAGGGNILEIHLATSGDGVNWTERGQMLFKGDSVSWDDTGVWIPEVWREGSDWFMIFSGQDSGGKVATGLATASAPEGPWTKSVNNPIFSGAAGKWDDDDAESHRIIKVGSTYYHFYNTLTGGPRECGIASTTDAPANWQASSWTRHNDTEGFITDSLGIYQGEVFKSGADFYFIAGRYQKGTDWGRLELWKDTDILFPSGTRTFVRYVNSCIGLDYDDVDTPSVLSTNINKDTYFDDKNIPMYYATHEAGSTSWTTRRITFNKDTDLTVDSNVGGDAQKGRLSWNDVTGAIMVVQDEATPSLNFGKYSGLLDDTSSGGSQFADYSETLSASRKISYWARVKNEAGSARATMYVYEGATLKANLGGFNPGLGNFQYWDGAFQDTGVAFVTDTWYQFIMEYDHVPATELWNIVIKDQDGTELFRANGRSFNGGNTDTLTKYQIRTENAFTGKLWMDEFHISQYNAANDPTTTVGAEVSGIQPYLKSGGVGF